MHDDLHKIEEKFDYKFNDKELLKLALTHPSYANEHHIEKQFTNQRLEYLGDAALELISSLYLYNKFSDYDEGLLTKLRAKLVCEESLSEVARKLNLQDYLLLGKGESKDKVKNNNSIMCDTVEAIIGSIFLDSGLDAAKKFVNKYILTSANINKNNNDYKSIIQELANSQNKSIKYIVANESGPDHNKKFVVEIYFNDKLYGCGNGKSKKEAEQLAAKEALKSISEGK